MSSPENPLIIEAQIWTDGGEFLSGRIRGPELTYFHGALIAGGIECEFDNRFTVERADTAFPALTLAIQENARLYEDTRRLWPTAIRPIGSYPPPPLPPPSQRLLLPAIALLFALLASMLLASGLG